MKILAIADRRIYENLPEIIKTSSIDLVILLGDLKYIDICDLVDSSVPILGVYGNHCMSNYFKELNAINVHMMLTKFGNYKIFGFEGCPDYKFQDHEFSQDEAQSLLEGSPGCDILIAHSPAFGINSSEQPPHEGFIGLTNYLNLHRPKFFFHGHSYPPDSQKISIYNDTIVYWVSGAEVIDLDQLVSLKNLPIAKSY
jgi:Icc-related predicted phosphoesterase